MIEEIRIPPKMPGSTLSSGEFNKILSKLNQLVEAANGNEENFNKLDNLVTKNQGYFETSILLNSEIPNPKVGETAWVGTPYPGVIYDCIVAGTWRNTNVSAEDAMRAMLNNMIDTLATTEDLDAINVILNQKFDSVTLVDGTLYFSSNNVVVATLDISTDILAASESASQSAISAQESVSLSQSLKNQCNDLFNSCYNAKNSAESAAIISVAAKDIVEADKIATSQYKNLALGYKNLALGYRNEAEGFSVTATTKAGEANASAVSASDSAQDALDYKNAAEQIVSAYFLYNITVAIPLTAGSFYTLTTALAAIPVNVRKPGLVITFADTATTWLTYKFIGSNVSEWGTISNWEVVPNKKYIDDELSEKEDKASKQIISDVEYDALVASGDILPDVLYYTYET